ncbi:MAG: hypothetical protein ACR2QC_07950 [Gammaproteobacteria bacterium]
MVFANPFDFDDDDDDLEIDGGGLPAPVIRPVTRARRRRGASQITSVTPARPERKRTRGERVRRNVKRFLGAPDFVLEDALADRRTARNELAAFVESRPALNDIRLQRFIAQFNRQLNRAENQAESEAAGGSGLSNTRSQRQARRRRQRRRAGGFQGSGDIDPDQLDRALAFGAPLRLALEFARGRASRRDLILSRIRGVPGDSAPGVSGGGSAGVGL